MRKLKILSYKRKREGKTDYKKRLSLLKSKKTRFVVRKSLKNILVQLINYDAKGDKILLSSHSNQLKKLGWKFHRGNIATAYLTGLLAGIKAKKQNITEAILDIGLYRPIKGSVLYAALKGAIDAGLKIPASKDIFPKEERLSGQHLSKELQQNFKEVKEKILALK